MSETESEDEILTKFTIANNLMSFSIFHNIDMDLLYEFISPIMKPNETVKAQANEIAAKADLVYTETKAVRHPKGFFLFIYEGNRIRISLILRQQGITERTLQLLGPMIEDFAEDLETKYTDQLKEFDGRDRSAFKKMGDFFENKGGLDLALPHRAKYVGFDPEDQLEQYVFGAADRLSRKIGYFYLPNMVYATKKYVQDKARDIVLTDPKRAKKEKIDPDNIDFPPAEFFYIAMYNLRKKGMLLPIQVDELRSFSKIKYPRMKK